MAPRKKPKVLYIDEAPEASAERSAPAKVLVPETPEVTPSQRRETPDSKPKMRKPSLILMLVFAFIALTVLVAFVVIPVKSPEEQPVQPKPKVYSPPPANCLKVYPEFDWGYPLHELECSRGAMEEGQNIGDLLAAHNVDYRQVIQLLELANTQQMPELQPGGNYHFLYSPQDLQRPVIFAYEPDPATFVFMNLAGAPQVYLHGRSVLVAQNRQREVVIKTNLADAMFNQPLGLQLATKLEDAIKYKVDLFHLAPGDRFTMLYKETQFEGDLTVVGDLLAVNYRQAGQNAYAFAFGDSAGTGFYDFEGRPMRSGFLMAPLEYGRISSGYNLHRPDPISKSGLIMPHLGTDYAAPEGTPILAVGDGYVLNAEFKNNNGNYVKLFHTDSIQTQYLHMSAFAEGIVPGAEVRQGQVIGYVGSTGRSTGPHVCFRYWKNGLQVDHRQESNFGTSVPLRGDNFQRFQQHRDSLLGMMTDL